MDLTGLLLVMLIGLVSAIIAAVAYTCVVLSRPPRKTFAYAIARGVPSDPSELPQADETPVRFTSWSFVSRGLSLPVWDIEGRARDGPIVIVSHGWSDSRIVALRTVPSL